MESGLSFARGSWWENNLDCWRTPRRAFVARADE